MKFSQKGLNICYNIVITMKITRDTIRLGNSAGVLLPKEWLGNEVTVTLKEEPLNIKQDILKLVIPYLENIIGIYLVGSYARKEETPKSDIDILIITDKLIKFPKIKKYHLIPVQIDSVRQSLKENPILIYPMIKEAKPILNKYLLEQLRQYKINLSKLKWYIETTESSLKVNKEFLNIEQNIEKNKNLKALSVIYSLILRLRICYLVDCILKNKIYTNKNLRKFINKKIKRKIFNEMYAVYSAVRDNKPIPKYKINLEDVKKLYSIVCDIIKKQKKLIYGK